MTKENELECQCEYDETGNQLYECELCYEKYIDECTCFDGEININCRECF